VDLRKHEILVEKKGSQGCNYHDYFAPNVIDEFKQRIQPAKEDDFLLEAVRSRSTGPQGHHHSYDMREEWIAQGHRFILSALLHQPNIKN